MLEKHLRSLDITYKFIQPCALFFTYFALPLLIHLDTKCLKNTKKVPKFLCAQYTSLSSLKKNLIFRIKGITVQVVFQVNSISILRLLTQIQSSMD